MALTDEQKRELKGLPIQGYLDWTGIDYTRASRKTLQLVDHDSLVVNTDRNQFYWNSRATGGDLVEFIHQYEDVPIKDALQKRLAYARYVKGADIDVSQYKNKGPQYNFDYSKWRKSDDIHTAAEYLTVERGMDAGLVEALHNAGLIEQGVPMKDKNTGEIKTPPVIFPWQDPTGKIVGADVQGTTIDYEKYGKRGTQKRIAAGSDDKAGYNIKLGNGADNLYIFETPIDLISYVQMNQPELQNQNATFVSMSGLKPETVYAHMKNLVEVNGVLPKHMYIATDRDKAGYQFADKFLEYEKMEVTRRIPVEGKDWNEQLKKGVSGEQLYRDMSLAENKKQLDLILSLSTTEVQNEEQNQVVKKTPSKKNRFDLPDTGLNPAEKVVMDGYLAKAADNDGSKLTDADMPPEEASISNPYIGEPMDTQATKPAKDERHVFAAKKKQQRRTPETQAARRQINREKNEKIIKSAISKVRDYQSNPQDIKKYLDFVSQGMRYSPRNTMLIYAQRENSTIVKGYNQWKAEGIQIQKGETGMKIFGAPTSLKTIVDENGQPIYWRDASDTQKARAEAGDLKVISKSYYPIETVFDVKQTNATLEQLPQLLPNRPVNLSTTNSPEQLDEIYKTLIQFAGEHSIDVYDQNTTQFLHDNGPMTHEGQAKGMFRMSGNSSVNSQILIRDDLPKSDQISVLAHEVGHAMLHTTTKGSDLPRPIKEVQAEMTSYVVLKNMGIDAGKSSERYMNNWASLSEKLSPDNTIKGTETTLRRINNKNIQFNNQNNLQGDKALFTDYSERDVIQSKNEIASRASVDSEHVIVRQHQKDGKLLLDIYSEQGFEEFKAEFEKNRSKVIEDHYDQIMGEVTRASTEVTSFLQERLTDGQTREFSQISDLKQSQNEENTQSQSSRAKQSQNGTQIINNSFNQNGGNGNVTANISSNNNTSVNISAAQQVNKIKQTQTSGRSR